MTRLKSVLFVLAAGIASACSQPQGVANAAPSDPPAPYVLKDTEVRKLHADSLNRDYQIFVSLPASYASRPDHRFPVIFVADADYAFPLVRSITRRVGDQGRGLEEAVIVGLSYADGDTPEFSRRRDYTPTPNGPKSSTTSDMPGRKPVHGEAEGYRRFIADQVFPLVARTYRVDMNRKIFAGHSYGSLLGVHMLLTEPTMFQRYILSSPSLWYDHRVMFVREQAYARGHKDLPAKVFLTIGGFETVKPGSNDPRYNKDDDMVADTLAFERVLKSRNYPGLEVQAMVIPDEDHLTVNPVSYTRGLVWALKP